MRYLFLNELSKELTIVCGVNIQEASNEFMKIFNDQFYDDFKWEVYSLNTIQYSDTNPTFLTIISLKRSATLVIDIFNIENGLSLQKFGDDYRKGIFDNA